MAPPLAGMGPLDCGFIFLYLWFLNFKFEVHYSSSKYAQHVTFTKCLTVDYFSSSLPESYPFSDLFCLASLKERLVNLYLSLNFCLVIWQYSFSII